MDLSALCRPVIGSRVAIRVAARSGRPDALRVLAWQHYLRQSRGSDTASDVATDGGIVSSAPVQWTSVTLQNVIDCHNPA